MDDVAVEGGVQLVRWRRARTWGWAGATRWLRAEAERLEEFASAEREATLAALADQVFLAEDRAVEDTLREFPFGTPWSGRRAAEAASRFRREMAGQGIDPAGWQALAMGAAYLRMQQTCRDQREDARPVRRPRLRVATVRLPEDRPEVDGAWRDFPASLGRVRMAEGAVDPRGAAYGECARFAGRWWLRLVWAEG